MTWKLETVRIGDLDYVESCRFVSETRGPAEENEIDFAFPGPLHDANGKLQWVLVAKPGPGEAIKAEAVAVRSYAIEQIPQEETPEDLLAKEDLRRRAAIAAALPDILLAVADGADLRDAVRKVIDSVEVQRE